MSTSFDFSRFQFAPVIHLPKDYEVYDFTKGYDPERMRASKYGVGRYDEKRAGMYVTDLFKGDGAGTRDIHVGVDIAAPAGTEVHAFFNGTIFMTGINPADGDYGGTVITEHRLGERTLWALHGHLSHASVSARPVGLSFAAGDVVGWLGEKHENGGWNPHLHFQLSWERPLKCDLPGAVNQKDRDWALATFPDPRSVLGPLY
jgi:murein DD-endopeptidase MepM/ murein hydrolase activator NlpD